MDDRRIDGSAPQVGDDEPSLGLGEVVMYATPFVSAAALVVSVSSLFGAGPLRDRRWLAAAIAVGSGFIFAKSQFDRFVTESPHYVVEARIGPLEIRRYGARTVAETRVGSANFDAALAIGFDKLAGYIFGGNDAHRRIAMTTPVQAAREDRGHVVQFHMPDEKALPTPSDPAVTFRELPPARVAAMNIRGRYTGARIERAMRELLRRAADAQLVPTGPAMFAGYDSPATLPLWRRTEVWVPIA